MIDGLPRDSYCLVGNIGHDFYEGKRDGSKGFPRFTDPSLRGPAKYFDYLKMAAEKSLERCRAKNFDLLLLHNPDSIGYTSPDVWDALERVKKSGLTQQLGIAPGPANGFTLDIIQCFEKFERLVHRHPQNLRDVFSLVANVQGFAIVAFAFADFTPYCHICQKFHGNRQRPR